MLCTDGKLDAYVRQLHSRLDTTTVAATLTLMVDEVRAAIDRQRRLIALQRLTRRNISASLNELETLKRVNSSLSSVLLGEVERAGEEIDDGSGTVVPLRVGASNRVR